VTEGKKACDEPRTHGVESCCARNGVCRRVLIRGRKERRQHRTFSLRHELNVVFSYENRKDNFEAQTRNSTFFLHLPTPRCYLQADAVSGTCGPFGIFKQVYSLSTCLTSLCL
jgi:hypothetical protein